MLLKIEQSETYRTTLTLRPQ